ncbi:MAG: hypothetical protein HY564_02690 [Candidatus Jacksonbacteria bacterium]|nr:hypothetical protein [Candidatus Jacksonbacteria bacterium]
MPPPLKEIDEEIAQRVQNGDRESFGIYAGVSRRRRYQPIASGQAD